MKIGLAVVVSALSATGIGLAIAAPANAWPTPPPPGCEQRPLVSYCDGLVQADGSWQRCFDNQPLWVRETGNWVGGSNCYQVGPGPDPYPWAPQYRIGG